MHVNLLTFDKETGATFELRDYLNTVEYIVVSLDGDNATKFRKLKVIEFLMELSDGYKQKLVWALDIDWCFLDKKISEIMNRKVHII
jgi:hypothetical protein